MAVVEDIFMGTLKITDLENAGPGNWRKITGLEIAGLGKCRKVTGLEIVGLRK